MLRRNARQAALVGRRSLLVLAAAAAGPMLVSPRWAQANTYTWDTNTTATHPQDGAGTWDTSPHWWDGANTNPWNNGNNDTAVFGAGATGGVITLPGPAGTNVTVGGLVFNNSGYVLGTSTGGVGSVNLQGSAIIAVNANATINAGLIGNSPDFVISPTSTLTTPGANFGFSGWTVDGGGTISVGSSSVSGGVGGTVTLNSGTILVGGSAGTSNNAVTMTGGTGAIISAGNATFNGSVTGSGVLYLAGLPAGNTFTVQNQDFSHFTGTFKVGLGNATVTTLRFNANNNSGSLATFDLGANGVISARSTNGTIELGALVGSAPALRFTSAPTNCTTTTYEIGGANIDSTFSGLILNNGSVASRVTAISKIGSGKLTLSGTDTYTGNTVIKGGTLAITIPQAVATSPSLQVNNTGSGVFDVTAVAGGYTIPTGQTLTGNGGSIFGTVNVQNTTGLVSPGANSTGNTSAGTLTFRDTLNLNGGTLNYDLSNNTGSGNDFLNVGSLEVSTPSHINISPLGSYQVGTYTIMNYTGSNLGLASLASNLSLTSSTGGVFQLITSNPGQIQVDVVSTAAAHNLRWNGAGTTWDVSTGTNFFDTGSSLPAQFFQGDNVTFDDTAGVPTTISLSGQLTPSSLHFNNSVNSFAFSGNGTISGSTGIVKDGTASVSFSNANEFLGGTTINNGTLRISNALALGNPATNANDAVNLNGGTLGVDSTITFTVPINVNAASTISSVGNATLSSTIQAIKVPLNFDLQATSVLSVQPSTFAGDFVTGTVSLGNSTGFLRFLGTPISSSAFFDLGTGSATINSRDPGQYTLGGLSGGPLTTLRGATSTNGADTFVFGVTGSNSLFYTPPTGVSTFAGTIANGVNGNASNAVNIGKSGPQWTLVLTGTNTYTGTTAINEGTLLVNGSHNGGGTYTVASVATFGGNGQISAAVDLSGSLVPGGANAVGALTVGTLIVEGGSTINFDVAGGNADKLTVAGVGTNSSGLNLANTANITVTDLGARHLRPIRSDRLQRRRKWRNAQRFDRLLSQLRFHHPWRQLIAGQQHAQHLG